MTGQLVTVALVATGVVAGTRPASATAELPLPDYHPAAVANPTATEPGGTVPIGGTRGEFSVTDSGAARYEVPLRVVPGRGGYQPELALTYDSGSANGQLGVGFSLSGLSHLSRCDRPASEGGIADGVRLDASDMFCLNGQRLMAVSGTYGGHGTEYRTRPDSHVRVRSYRPANATAAGPAYFTVWTADGQIQHYGKAPDDPSTGDAVQIKRGNQYVNIGWPIVRSEDRSGHAITYSYNKRVASSTDASEVERTLAMIEYGDGSSGSFDRAVQFSYGIRPDRGHGWLYGSRREQTFRLTGLEMYINVDGTARRAHSYDFEYDNTAPTWASRLVELIECGSSPNRCKRPTTFTWRTGSEGFGAGQTQVSPTGQSLVPSTGVSQFITGDYNGDGRTDLVWPEGQVPPGTEQRVWRYLHAGADGEYTEVHNGEFNGSNRGATAYPIDYDLDGMTDLMPREPQIFSYRPILSRPDFTYRRAETPFEPPFMGGFNQVTGTSQTAGALLGDYNGDGLQDLLEYRDPLNDVDGDFVWGWKLRTGHVSSTIDDETEPFDQLAFSQPQQLHMLTGIAPSRVLVLDLNGDGRDELLYSDSPLANTLLKGYDFMYPDRQIEHGLTTTAILDVPAAVMLDVNGDGLDDIVRASFDNISVFMTVMVNTGHGYGPKIITDAPVYADELRAAQVIDYNGDGRHDLLLPRRNSAGQFVGLDVVRSSLASDGTPVLARSQTPVTFAPQPLDFVQRQGFRVVDADGDGQHDVLVVNRPAAGAPSLVLYSHLGSDKPDLLHQIREGTQLPTGAAGSLPPTVNISFAPLTDASVYKLGDCPRIPFLACLTGATYVVRQIQQDAGINGAGHSMRTFYTYRGGRMDLRARSFLGFAERRSVRSGPGTVPVEERTFYSNTFPGHDPRPVERWLVHTMLGGRQTLDRTSIFWWQRHTNAGNYFDYITRTDDRYYDVELGCSCLTSWTPAQLDAQDIEPLRRLVENVNGVDAYGNVETRSSESTGNGSSRTDVLTSHAIDETNWLVRRPSRIMTKEWVLDPETGQWSTQTRTSDYTYQPGTGRVSQERRYGSEVSPGRVLLTDYGYDGDGNVNRVKRTDAQTGEVRESTAVYDPYGYPHASMNALGHITRTGYDPISGLLKVVVDANGLRTDHSYDSLGRPVRTRQPGGATSTMEYALETRGNEQLMRTTVTDSTGALSQAVVDRAGRPLLERFEGMDGQLRERESQYRVEGWLAWRTVYHPAGSTGTPPRLTFGYDGAGRLIEQRDPSDGVRRWEHLGLQTTTIDSRGGRSVTTVDHRGKPVSVVDGAGTAAQVRRTYVYGPFGDLLRTEIDGVPASRSTFQYDNLGALIAGSEPERGTTSNTYNAFGEVVTSLDAAGRQTQHGYDLLGRAVTRTVSQAGSVRSTTSNLYDSDGSRTHRGRLLASTLTDQATGGVQTGVTYLYDGLNRLSQERYQLPSDSVPGHPETLSMHYDRDQSGRVTTVRYPGLAGNPAGTTVAYDYAPTNGRLSHIQVASPDSEKGLLWRAEESDGQDRLVREASGDGVVTERAFSWHPMPTRVEVRTGEDDHDPNAPLVREDYSYDTEGNLASRSRSNRGQDPVTEVYAYDVFNRVVNLAVTWPGHPVAHADAWSYDRLGNITASQRRGTYQYDPQRPTQVTSVSGGLFGDRAYTYDAVGNQVGRPEGQVSYNDRNLPARIAGPAGGHATEFLYYPDGQRARKVTASGSTTYLPGRYERHRVGNRVEHRMLVQAEGRTVAVLVRQQAIGAPHTTPLPARYPHTDRQGSTIVVTANDGDAGMAAAVREARSYDAYGLVRDPDWRKLDGGFTTELADPAVDQGYTGHVDDRDLALVNMGGRIYDAELGRFLSADPNVDGANASQAWNRYAYVSGNPLRHTDPTGFMACFGCPVELTLSGGSGWSPALDLMMGWMQDDDAFFEAGAAGLSGSGDRAMDRALDRYERNIKETLHHIDRREQIQQALHDLKTAMVERERQQAQRYKESKPALGGSVKPPAASGPMYANNDVCPPGTCSTETSEPLCQESLVCEEGETRSDAVADYGQSASQDSGTGTAPEVEVSDDFYVYTGANPSLQFAGTGIELELQFMAGAAPGQGLYVGFSLTGGASLLYYGEGGGIQWTNSTGWNTTGYSKFEPGNGVGSVVIGADPAFLDRDRYQIWGVGVGPLLRFGYASR